MAKVYVEERNGGLYLAGSRVSLDSIVYDFLRGESPEGIADAFPAVGLEEIFGGLAYYLANRETVDQYLSAGRKEFETMRERAQSESPEFYARLREARERAKVMG